MPKFSFEKPSKLEEEKKEEEKKQFRQFLAEQIVLPSDKWTEGFEEYVEEKNREEKEREEKELSPEEKRRLDFERYLKGLDLKLQDLEGKRVLDLGCGEGNFVRQCLEEDISKEVYGLDLNIDQDEYQEHFFEGDFEEELPVDNLDYVVSFGAIEALSNEEDKSDPKKPLLQAIQALKVGGEIRIFPVRKAPPESDLKGIDFSREKWMEILEDLSSENEISYELKPVDIRVSGKKPDVWLEEVLIIRKKERPEHDFLLKKVEPIGESERIILRKEELEGIIEKPLLAACQELYDKNIQTVSTSANRENIKAGLVYIDIDYESLSLENREIAERLGKLQERNGHKRVKIEIPVDEQTSIAEIKQRSKKIAEEFKKQPMTWAPTYAIKDLKEIFGIDPDEHDFDDPQEWEEQGYFYDEENKVFYLSQEHYKKATEKIE